MGNEDEGLPLPVVASQSRPPHQPAKTNPTEHDQHDQIEDSPSGYPQFSALLSSHPYFYVFRKFSRLRTRVLLQKQYDLSRLEQKLQELDEGEACPLFRSSFRLDRNEHRRQLIREIDRHLEEYDKLVERTERNLRRPAAAMRDITNVRNWISSTGQIVKEETKYLWAADLAALGVSGEDPTYFALEGPIENAIIWASKITSKVLFRKSISRRPGINILSKNVIEVIARILIAALLLMLLFVPIAVSLSIGSVALRIFAALLACSIFILALSVVTKAKTAELFVAGATYSALLVVFITGST